MEQKYSVKLISIEGQKLRTHIEDLGMKTMKLEGGDHNVEQQRRGEGDATFERGRFYSPSTKGVDQL